MSKRRSGGVWNRKASNLAAKEGWSQRESNIKDFMKYSHEQIDSQYNLNIEWASSDEEEKSSKLVKTANVQKICKINSDQQIKKDNAFCNFNDKLEDFGIYNKRKFTKRHTKHKSSNSCLNHKITLKTNVSKVIENPKDRDTAILEQDLSHKYNENSNTFGTLSTVKVRVNESEDEKNIEISPVIITHNLASKKIEKPKQDLKDTEKYQQDQKDAENDISLHHSVKKSVSSEKKSPVFKTQEQFGKSSPTSLSPQKKSPVLSALRNCKQKITITEQCSPVFKSKVKSAYKSPKIGTQNIVELESPVLKSKNLKQSGSPILNSRRVLRRKLTFGYYSVPNKALVRDVPVQPHTEYHTNHFCEREKISENIFTPLSGKGNSVIRIKKKQRNLTRAFTEHKEDNIERIVDIKEGQSESKNMSARMEFEKIDRMSNGNCSLERNSTISKNSIKSNVDVEDLNNKVNVNFKVKPNKSFLKSYQDCFDPSIMAIEGVNDTIQVQSESQESEPIEECMTPSKETSSDNVHHHTDCLGKSVSKCSSTISVLKENVEGQKGSEWLQALHQKTPERPCKDNEQIADPDSSKKKILKDGLAARLRRLSASWQSSVQMWKYQISLSEEQNPQKTTAACSTTIQTPKLLQLSQSSDLSYTSDVSDGKQVREKLLREVKSPALRNLRCALLVGPTESSKRQETIIEPPKKKLLLKIVKIGGRLPAGGALCEKIDSLDTSNSYQVVNGAEAIHNNKIYNNSLHITEKNQQKKSERFVVIFASQEQNDALNFQVTDQVIIYSPWHHLDLPGKNIPTLFSSYFTIQSRIWQLNEGNVRVMKGEWSKSPLKKKINKKKIILTSWTCACSTDSTILPTLCEGRNFHLKHRAGMFNLSVSEQHKMENVCGNFKVIQDSSNKLQIQNSGRPQSWSIVEAIEKCGGLSDIPITVILHIYRIIRNKDLLGNNDHWLLIGADIMGVFCTVTIPDRPLARHLSPLLDEGEGTIHAITQLTVTQRHTDNKSPGLFSLLHSLHHAYQKAIKEYENVMTPYMHNDSKAPQSFCYNFTVTLGSTKSQLVTGIPNVPISLPLWSVPEALKVSGVAQRGSIFLHIIYKVDCYLYVICPDEYTRTSDQSSFSVTSKEESRLGSTHTIKSSETYDSICKEKKFTLSNGAPLVTRVSVQDGSTLPTWLAKDGTIMQGAIIRDIISYKGMLMVDEFSEFKVKKSEVNLTLGNLYHILPKLKPDSNSHQLVHVSGNIHYVDEENAFSWPICEHCTSEKLQDTLVQYGGMECLKCGKISLSPETGYSLEVFLDCMELPNTSVKIKLYQRTIKKLISSCLVSEGEGYDATCMIGRVLGPLVCFIEEVKSRTVTNPRTFILLQLPY